MFSYSKLEYKDVSQESPPARDLRNIIGPVFRDNFNLTEEPPLSSSNLSAPVVKSSLPSNNQLKGFTNSLIYIGKLDLSCCFCVCFLLFYQRTGPIF